MKKIDSIILFAMLVVITSCTTIKRLPIDQMLPADISFPSQVRNVVVVNNLPFPPDRWPKEFSYKDMEKVIDGDGAKAAEILAECIADGNYFDQVLICDSALRANDTRKRISPLNQEEVTKLAGDMGADMIVSLDAIVAKATPGAVYVPESVEPVGVMNVSVKTVVRLYIPSRKEPLTTLADRDSICWLTPVISEDEILEKASEFAATILVKHLVPSWKTSDRYIYTGGSADMRDAEISIKEGAWDNALSSWEKMLSSKSRKQRMYAAFNTALYYEVHDDLDSAEKWVRKAMELVPEDQKLQNDDYGDYSLMEYYLTELEERRVQMQKLNLQMNRFKDDF